MDEAQHNPIFEVYTQVHSVGKSSFVWPK